MLAGSLVLWLAALVSAAVQAAPQRVRVVVREQLIRGEAPVAGLSVALGCTAGWSFVGPPETSGALRVVTLDERGQAEVELELPPDLGAKPGSGDSRIWGQVVSPGFQQWVRSADFDAAGRVAHLAMPARPGGTLYGVVRAEPSSVRGNAQVRLVRSGPPPAAASAAGAPALIARADSEGRFALHFTERGRYDLHASWAGRGTAVLRDLALELHGVPSQVTLDIAPGLGLAGRVVDPDGKPVYPFTLSALPEGFEHLSSERALREWSAGVYGERVVTDQEGRFALHGLPAGRYALVGALDTTRPEVLSRQPIPAGTLDATVEARVHRLALRVLDHEGKPRDLSVHQKPFYELRPDDPVLHCRKGEPALGSAPVAFQGSVFEHEAIAVVESGAEVHLAFAAPDIPLVERRLRMPEEPWLVTADLRLPPPVEPAVLRLKMVADGRPFAAAKTLSLLSPSGVDVTSGASLQDSELVLSVSPGTYRLRLRPTHFLFCWGGSPEELVPEFAPAEAEVELVSGRETELELGVRANARLRLALELPSLGSASEIVEIWETAGDYREPMRRALGGARVELWPAQGGEVLRPEFSVAVPELPARSALCAPWFAPGRECVSISAIPPGTYRLVVEFDDTLRTDTLRTDTLRTDTLRTDVLRTAARRIELEVTLAERSTTSVTLAPSSDGSLSPRKE